MIKKIANKNKIQLQITGLDACPSYNIISKNWLHLKTIITQELLNEKILGANTTYTSISHNDKIIKIYEKKLNKIFKFIFKIQSTNENLNNILKGPVCHSGFKRLN